jgi:hypothetical protein
VSKGLKALPDPIKLGILANVFIGIGVCIERTRARISEPHIFVLKVRQSVRMGLAFALCVCPYRSNQRTRVPARFREAARAGAGGLSTMSGECGEDTVYGTNDVQLDDDAPVYALLVKCSRRVDTLKL